MAGVWQFRRGTEQWTAAKRHYYSRGSG